MPTFLDIEITKYWKVGSGFAMESKRQYKYVSPYFCKKTKTEERNIKFAEICLTSKRIM
jgi:hypothetical protein